MTRTATIARNGRRPHDAGRGHGRPTRPAPVELREEFAAPQGQPHKVDREAGVIYGVKLLGKQSPNTHHTTASKGTLYTGEALEKAKPLYEGLACYIDHPEDRDNPAVVRDAEDCFGEYHNVQVREDGLYADLHYLKSHPMAAVVCEAAERMPGRFPLSHNAGGDGEVKDGWFVVSDLHPRSVDIVTKGGTNRTLFESAPMTTKAKVKIGDVLRGAVKKLGGKHRPVVLASLLEDDYMAAETEPMAEEAKPEEQISDALRAAIDAVLGGEGDKSAKMKKIKAILDAEEKLLNDSAEGETKAETKESDEEDEGKDKKEKKADDKEKSDTKESVETLKNENAALKELLESGVAKPSTAVVKALAALKEPAERKQLLESLKPDGQRGQTPRSGVPGGTQRRDLKESAGGAKGNPADSTADFMAAMFD